jgi:hypothetical protein
VYLNQEYGEFGTGPSELDDKNNAGALANSAAITQANAEWRRVAPQGAANCGL